MDDTSCRLLPQGGVQKEEERQGRVNVLNEPRMLNQLPGSRRITFQQRMNVHEELWQWCIYLYDKKRHCMAVREQQQNSQGHLVDLAAMRGRGFEQRGRCITRISNTNYLQSNSQSTKTDRSQKLCIIHLLSRFAMIL